MKTETKTTDKPVAFVTPHEQKAIDKVTKKKTNKPKAAKAKDAKATGRDAFGGRIGTRMSKINLVVINAGSKGANIHEVAAKTKEDASIVSAQLGWIKSKGLATRREETNGDDRKTFRYFAKVK